ncbi:MAG: hypothetical protein EOO01_42845, partial [Chitinophagaceae bacterium]
MKITISVIASLFSAFAFCQTTDDKLQQEAPREQQVTVERSAQRDAKQQSNKEINAERLSKEKGQTQKQTKTQPKG